MQTLETFDSFVYTQIKGAIAEPDNNGKLWIPSNSENLRAVTFLAPAPALAPKIMDIAGFDPGEEVHIEARYRYGSLIETPHVWLRRPGEASALTIGAWLINGEEHTFPPDASRDGVGKCELDQTDLRHVFDEIFKDIPGYTEAQREQSIGKALLLGIDGLWNASDVQTTTVDVGYKSFSRDDFTVTARSVNHDHPQDQEATTRIDLERGFNGEEYGLVFEGMARHSLVIVRDAAGSLTNVERESSIHLYDNPYVVSINGVEQVASLASEAGEYELPDKLRSKLYVGEEIAPDDISHFERLLSQPITAADVSLDYPQINS